MDETWSGPWETKVFACTLLGAAYLGAAVTAGAQFVRLVQRGAPWTTQKVLHVLILIAASVRVLFFYVASVAWDMGKGELSASEPVWRMAFYVCDELPTLLFFTVYTAVLLFWAELYYIASDASQVYETMVQPLDSAVNTAAYVVLVVLWALDATAWSSFDECVAAARSSARARDQARARAERARRDGGLRFETRVPPPAAAAPRLTRALDLMTRRYATRPYTVFVAALYICTSAVFVFYGRSAARELSHVPIELGMRRRKLREVGVMTWASTLAMVARAVVLLMIADSKIPLEQSGDVARAVLYFALLEFAPIALVLFYYRRMPQPMSRTLLPEETRLFGGVLSGSHEMRYFQTATSVDDTIRRLSELRYDQHL